MFRFLIKTIPAHWMFHSCSDWYQDFGRKSRPTSFNT